MKNYIKKLLFFMFTAAALSTTAKGMTEAKMQELGISLIHSIQEHDLIQTQKICLGIKKLFPPKKMSSNKVSALVFNLLDTRCFYNMSPLILATINNNVGIVRELITTAGEYLNKIDFERFINAKDKENLTALDITTKKINVWGKRTIRETLAVNSLLKKAIEWNNKRIINIEADK